MPTYSQKNFERIAAAVGVDVDILQFRREFEEATNQYRLNIPPAKREGGPTFELRNQALKEVNKASKARKPRSKKTKTLSQLRKKRDKSKPRHGSCSYISAFVRLKKHRTDLAIASS